MKKIFYLVLVVSAVVVSSCKKNSKGGGTTPDPTKPSKTGTTLQLAQDSIWLYAKEAYLWNDQLPDYATFKPRSFTNAAPKTALDDEMDALSQYAINPTTNKPYEYYKYAPGRAKYSFIDDGTETGALNGTKGDFGFDYNYQAVDDIRIVYVYAGSPAGLAGLRRGYRIVSVNNSTNIDYDGVSDGYTYGDGSGTNINFLFNSVFNSGNIKMTIKKPNGSTFDVNFAAANYNVNPVLKDTVYDLGGGKKLGYFVFNSFTSDDNADPKLDAVFTKFANAGVTEVAVDLRYNGGGYVSTAEYIDNYLVPTSKNNTLMYNTYFNSILSSNSETLLKNQVRKDVYGSLYNLSQIDYSLNSPYNTPKFTKKGNLNLSRVFFIITGGTASASELTINNLRPALDVELVGETSYGKPVGFFDIGINKYTMFTPEFSTKNSANQGDYFDGFTPDTPGLPGKNTFDDYTKDFGDPTEKLLAEIIKKITTNVYSVPTQVIQSVDPAKRTFSLAESRDKAMVLNKNKFTGMLFNFKKVKLKTKK